MTYHLSKTGRKEQIKIPKRSDAAKKLRFTSFQNYIQVFLRFLKFSKIFGFDFRKVMNLRSCLIVLGLR